MPINESQTIANIRQKKEQLEAAILSHMQTANLNLLKVFETDTGAIPDFVTFTTQREESTGDYSITNVRVHIRDSVL